MAANRPNVVLVFGDQWRAQATGFGGGAQVRTPHLDRLAAESIHFTHAVSGCPVCSPARASLMTGQYPVTHGVFVNDVCLSETATSLAQAFSGAGYDPPISASGISTATVAPMSYRLNAARGSPITGKCWSAPTTTMSRTTIQGIRRSAPPGRGTTPSARREMRSSSSATGRAPGHF